MATLLCGNGVGQELTSLWQPEWRQAAIIADTNTRALFAGEVRRAVGPLVDTALVLDFPAGEKSKNRRTKERIEDAMLGAGIGRSAAVIALGGGVVTDLAGYVAATYMRGLPLVNVATTVLAQVDAAIGGKCGVNTPLGKNLIGAFHPPTAVLLHIRALKSLPPIQWKSGLAEAVKNAFIGDAGLFGDMEKLGDPQSSITGSLLLRCARIKERIAARDVRDRGPRAQLNFGHTIAHAIERTARYRVPHGFAVAIGMMVEGEVAKELSGLSSEALARLRAILSRIGLPVAPSQSFDDIADALRFDKKRTGSATCCALPKAVGRMDRGDGNWVRQIPEKALRAAWRRAQEQR